MEYTHGLQYTYSDMNGFQYINYGDVDHKADIDITKRITSVVNKLKKYQSYKGACKNNTITYTIIQPLSSE